MATNWSGNITLPDTALAVSTPEGVRRAVQSNLDAGKKIRAIGGRYSTSHVLAPATGGTLFDLRNLRLSRAPNESVAPKVASFASRGKREWFRGSTAGLVQISTSASIDEVNQYLSRQKRALPMLGSFSGQTFVGALLTGTHGSGLHGPLAEFAVSLDVVSVGEDGRAKLYRVERRDGPTHADYYAAATGVTVIQDDDVFHAFVISFGYFGVVTSVTVRSVPQFWLAGKGEIVPWSTVRARLSDADARGIPQVLHSTYSMGVVLSPYRATDGSWPTCTWHTTQRTADRTSNQPQPCVLMPALAVAPLIASFASSREIPAAVDSLVRSTCVKENCGVAHQMLSSPDGFALRGYGLEFAFPVEPKLRYLDAVEALLREVAKMENESPALRIAGFFSLRFVGASSACLAQSYDPAGRPWCTLEVLCAAEYGTPDRAMPRLLDVAVEHGGRPHWGQIFDVAARVSDFSGARVKQLLSSHPGYPTWKKQHQRFNGTGVFSNPISEYMP